MVLTIVMSEHRIIKFSVFSFSRIINLYDTLRSQPFRLILEYGALEEMKFREMHTLVCVGPLNFLKLSKKLRSICPDLIFI